MLFFYFQCRNKIPSFHFNFKHLRKFFVTAWKRFNQCIRCIFNTNFNHYLFVIGCVAPFYSRVSMRRKNWSENILRNLDLLINTMKINLKKDLLKRFRSWFNRTISTRCPEKTTRLIWNWRKKTNYINKHFFFYFVWIVY